MTSRAEAGSTVRSTSSWRRSVAIAGVIVALITTAATRPARPRPRITHVFVIVLENQSYDAAFGSHTAAPYLADTLVAAGALLRQYYAIGHFSLDNYIALISGVAPDHETQADCDRYQDFTATGVALYGQPIGRGCVYPASVPTIANQLSARALTWKGYMEDMGNDSTRERARCGHPPLNAVDQTEHAQSNDQYAAKHNPFVYFHAIVDSASCRANVVPLRDLDQDLRSAGRTPNFGFVVPNLCHDGHDQPCSNGEPGGLVSADRFLAYWVPRITRAPAFRAGGLLIVTFDEGSSEDGAACCGEVPGPNAARPGLLGPGGGRIGAVLVSPFIKPGTVSDVPYNHYALLKSIEDVFGLAYLGYAGRPGLASFGTDVFGAPLGRR